MERRRTIINALTVDLEDYFHVTAFERCLSRRSWDSLPSRVVPNTQRLLDQFNRHNVKATFFALGWIADRFPQLIREIAEAGHELACHSYWHRLVYQMTPAEFRDDLRQARNSIEDAWGTRIVAYRAPSWSITAESLWALDILAEEEFAYDSSIFPIHHDRYGIPNAIRHPHPLPNGAAPLWEFPAAVIRFLKLNVPISGGGYLRLYPVSWTVRWLRRINEVLNQPFLIYVHPWELDPDQPRVCAPWKAWRHFVNLSTTATKLDALLMAFRFGRMGDVLRDYMAQRVEVSRLTYTPKRDAVPDMIDSVQY
jgi:polysaccharide deacetylase family protein (PEP-CTERM system associated)